MTTIFSSKSTLGSGMKHALSGKTSAQPEPKAGYQLMRLKMKLLRSKATFKARRGGIGPVGNSSLSVQFLRPSAIFASSFTDSETRYIRVASTG